MCSLIQSTYGTPKEPGNFEVVVLEGHDLVHYYRNNSDPRRPWTRTVAITTKATGPGSLIQSTYGTPKEPGNFEVVVLEGHDLVHYYRNNSDPEQPWTRTGAITTKATGPGSLIQSTYGTPKEPGNFEVVVLEGHDLVHYYRNNSDPRRPWTRAEVITGNATM